MTNICNAYAFITASAYHISHSKSKIFRRLLSFVTMQSCCNGGVIWQT